VSAGQVESHHWAGVGARAALGLALALLAGSQAVAGPEEDGNAGLDAMKSGDYTRAVQMFSRALASGKLSGDDREFAYVQRGTAYLSLKNKAAAVADFEKALKIKPDDADAKQGLAEARGGGGARGGGNALELAKAGAKAMDSGDYAQAVSLFSRAIGTGRLAGDDLELAYLSRGQAYLKQGDARSAIPDLDQALRSKSDDTDAQAALGEALTKLPPPSPGPGFDAGACKKAMTNSGSTMGGKTFTSFVDYSGFTRLDAFAGLYRAVNRHSPALGASWQVTGANLRDGVLTAEVTPPGSSSQVKLNAKVETSPAATRVTMVEQMTGPILIVDIKGSMCKTLNDLAH
jgi:tetratricopeptide (TPR) repeat protein